MTPNSSLKFTPEELLLYCRDLRVVCFLFDRLTPDAQVIEVSVLLRLSGRRPCLLLLFLRCPAVKLTPAVVPPPQITYTIARTYQPPRPGSVLSFQNAALGSVGESAASRRPVGMLAPALSGPSRPASGTLRRPCPVRSLRGQNVLQAVDQLSTSGLLVVCLRFLPPVDHLMVFIEAAATEEAAALELRLRWRLRWRLCSPLGSL